MKKLITILLILVGMSAFGQTPSQTFNGLLYQYNNGHYIKGSAFIPRDTVPWTGSMGDSGRIAFKDGKFWGHHGVLGWVEIGKDPDLSAYMRKKPSRIFPYDSSYYIAPSVAGASDIELVNFGNTAHLDYPIYQNPMALWANNWAMGFGVNVQYDSTAKRYKVFNPDYPVSYYEAGWEGVTLHVIPANQADTVDQYPHEPFQVRPGLDGDVLIDPNRQYIQIKAPLAARYDTSFNVGETSYGWWGPDTRPFQWYFSEYPMSNGNIYAQFDQYTSQASSAPKFQFRRSRGSYSAPAAVQAGDTLGNIQMFSHDGSSFLNTVRLYGKATANATAGSAPTVATLRASDGGASAGELSVSSSGNVGVNTDAPVGIIHAVKEGFGGAMYIDRYSNGLGNLPPAIYGIRANGSLSSPSGVLKNDELLSLAASGAVGSTLDRTARGAMSFSADADWSGSNMSTRFDLYLTSTINDARRVLSIDHTGHAAFADTTDPTARLWVDGYIKAQALPYSSGSYSLLVKNAASDLFETVSPTAFAPSSPSGDYVQLSPLSRQAGSFSINSSSDIVSTGNAFLSIGQTTATPTNQAGLVVDGVNGDFIGGDYLRLIQLQTGEVKLQNLNSASMTLGAGGASSNNIVLNGDNSTSFGGAVHLPLMSTSGNVTLDASHHIVRVTSTAHAVTLPSASSCAGRVYSIQNYNTGGNVTISSVQIYGVSTTAIPNNTEWTVYSDGSDWVLKSRSN